MSVTGTAVSTTTTRWTVNTLAAQICNELSGDANATGATVPDKQKAIARNCGARLWDMWDWRFRRRQFTLAVWDTQTGTCTGGSYNGTTTTLTANTGTFYDYMRNHSIVITGVGTFTVASYTSGTVIAVTGDASAASAAAWTVTADGTYAIPTWMEKLDQRMLKERNHDSTVHLKLSEDVQVYQRTADVIDLDSDNTTAEPEVGVLVRNHSASGFIWHVKVAPLPDDVYQYDLWAIVANPFTAESQSDDAIMPWPPNFDHLWECFVRYRMAPAFGRREEMKEYKDDFDYWLKHHQAENNETQTTQDEPIDQDPHGDLSMLSSQFGAPLVGGSQWPY